MHTVQLAAVYAAQVPPASVTSPFIELLGVLKWLVTVIGITVLMGSAAFLWADGGGTISSWLATDPGIARRRVIKVLWFGIVVNTAGALAWWLLS